MKLKDRVIVVIGASGGIGRVLSRELHRAGAIVVLVARHEDKLKALQKELGQERTIVYPMDAGDPLQVPAMFEGLRQKHNLIVDAIVISAGKWEQLSINEFPSRAIALAELHFGSIFRPTFVSAYVAQRFFREVAGGKGLIINISSHAAVRPELEGNLTYGPMKAAARHFMLALRNELKDTLVRVVDLQPAIVNTPDNAKFLDTLEKKLAAVQPEEIAQWIIAHFNDQHILSEKLFDSSLVV